jgi:hypothetical protein
MALRSDLHELLKTLLGSDHVYFQPPETVKLTYPCIIYERNRVNTRHANDLPYLLKKRYQVIVIDRDPDSEIPDKVANLPLCSFDRFYTADNLNHDVYNLFF